MINQRVEANGDWNLFCPNEAPGLADTHSDEFKVSLFPHGSARSE